MIVAAGKYKARANSYAMGYTKTGGEQIAVAFTITDDGPAKGHGVPWTGFFGPKSEERTIKALRIMGWKDDPANLDSILENEVEIDVQHEEYQGRVQVRVAWVNAIGVRLHNQMSVEDRTKFLAEVLHRYPRGGKPSNGQPKQTSIALAPAKEVVYETADPSDDIPF